MRDVAVLGVGITKWGEIWKQSLRDVYVETALLALQDAGASLEPLFREMESELRQQVLAEGVPPERIRPPLRQLDPDLVLFEAVAAGQPEDDLPPEALVGDLFPLPPPLPGRVAREGQHTTCSVFAGCQQARDRLTGRVDHRGDDVKMIAQQIQEPRFDVDSVVRLRVPATRMSRSTVEQLRSVLANHPGNAGVFLHMVSDGDERVIQLGNDHRVEPRTALFAELRELLGPSVVL